MNVMFVVLPELTLLDLAGPAEVFRTAIRFGAPIRLQFVGPAPTAASSVGIPLAEIAPLPGTIPDDTVVLVPGATDSRRDYATAPAAIVVDWLRRTVTDAHMLCFICSAALLAARAGLLNGRRCTTHWSLQQRLAAEAPMGRLQADRVYVVDGNLVTSAGAASGIDIALFLLRRHFGPELASQVAELLVIYYYRAADETQHSPWIELRRHEHPRVRAAQELVLRDPARGWTVAALARDLAISERHLARLFRAHVRVSPRAFIRAARVAASGEMVRHSRLSMEQIAERCGFQSSEQMRRAWKQEGQPLPSTLRRSVLKAEA